MQNSTIQQRARQAEAIARNSIKGLSGRRLTDAWNATDGAPHTRQLVIVRGWLLDEIEGRMNALDSAEAKSPLHLGQFLGRFDRWMAADSKASDGTYVSPLGYLV